MPVTNRPKRLHVMLSVEEWKMVQALAEQEGQGVSNWARQLIRAEAKAKLKKPKQRRR
ncbi:MAG TPA: hypothetical protein PKD61_36140 [Polyangiaceae bacterium]|nr:hypothetical protein [Polyangiaceae bacterium]